MAVMGFLVSSAFSDVPDDELSVLQNPSDSIACRLDSVALQMDTMDAANHWKRVIFRKGWSINDTTILYPKVLDACAQGYRWLNHTFNYYDSAYVVNPGTSSGKKWKFMLKNDNWLDFYSGHLSKERTYVQLHSNLTSLFGFQISGMGLSITYMINVRDLLSGKFLRNRRFQFSVTSSRIFLEAYFRDNNHNSIHLKRLGEWSGNVHFSGLKRVSYGIDAYYIFNHTHYSQAAAYCFSKYQKRSSGSLLSGIYISHQDVSLDMNLLSEGLKQYLPNSDMNYRFRYGDVGLLIGYGYSWVFHQGWLYNVTFAPSIGYRNSFPSSIEGKKKLVSTNITGKMALVRTAGNFFYAITANHEGHWYTSRIHSFYNSYTNIDLTAGFRF